MKTSVQEVKVTHDIPSKSLIITYNKAKMIPNSTIIKNFENYEKSIAYEGKMGD